MAKGYRQGRLGEEIKRVISGLLLRELKDPRLQAEMVSLSAVDVTPDGSYATVYVTALGLDPKKRSDKQEQEEVLLALKSAKGFIRREIGKQIKLRHVPDLIFKFDTSLEYGRHIEQIISDLGIPNGEKEDEE